MPRFGSIVRRFLPDFGALATSADTGTAGEEEIVAQNARAFAPVVWLIGKVQSGKSSIIRTITKSEEAEVGSGFKACTRTARIFDFPAETPVLRFLDTRGLGEVDYDPAEDLAFCEQRAHLVLAVARAMDPQQEVALEALQIVRRAHPSWPIVVAQTSLHEGYARGQNHPHEYPFDARAPADPSSGGLPPDLLRSLAFQRSLFATLPGTGTLTFVPIDFTKSEDGFTPVDFGLDALSEALIQVAPSAMIAALGAMPGLSSDTRGRQTRPLILGHATAAAASDLVPVAGAVAVSAIQARLLHRLASVYNVAWDKRALAEFAAALGTGTIVRALSSFGIRQLAKLIPVYGQTAAAATSAVMSFAVTYALGEAAAYFLSRRRLGTADPAGVARAYRQALQDAFRIARDRELRAGERG